MTGVLPMLGRFLRLARQTWTLLGVALALLVAVETGSALAFSTRRLWHSPYTDYRIHADTYTDTSWVIPYYTESEQMPQMRWKSYVYWRRQPYRGKYVNVNAEGLRKTCGQTDPEASRPAVKKVFMFGGSTMFGSGVKDEWTIPSIFAKEIGRRGVTLQVVNLGIEAYVSTQEVIELMLQLRKGNIPDAVIFFDGVNDTAGGFQLGVAGLPHNEFNREEEFNLLQRDELRRWATRQAASRLYSVRLLRGILRTAGLVREPPDSLPLRYETPIADRSALARAVVETYLSNMKLVRAMSEEYGFKYLFYWQPMIYQKRHLTAYERQVMQQESSYAGMREFYTETYDYLRQRAAALGTGSPLHDLSLMFLDRREPLFLDLWHLGETGNKLIAERMVNDVLRLLNVQMEAVTFQGQAPAKPTKVLPGARSRLHP